VGFGKDPANRPERIRIEHPGSSIAELATEPLEIAKMMEALKDPIGYAVAKMAEFDESPEVQKLKRFIEDRIK